MFPSSPHDLPTNSTFTFYISYLWRVVSELPEKDGFTTQHRKLAPKEKEQEMHRVKITAEITSLFAVSKCSWPRYSQDKIRYFFKSTQIQIHGKYVYFSGTQQRVRNFLSVRRKMCLYLFHILIIQEI